MMDLAAVKETGKSEVVELQNGVKALEIARWRFG